jgi:hypothetical protein
LTYNLNFSLNERVVKLQFHGGNREKFFSRKEHLHESRKKMHANKLSLKLFEEEPKKNHLANTPFNKV